ncbi:hypothetical protein N566_09625 [Streptomycetaceae bacterium MP113-05]|nr:hypothetical protein N566_09625 [Streptomycetaceae bacterium MP113-05]
MRDDVDLCWRANAAGHRVLVVPESHLRHAEAASRERRPVDCAGRGGGASPHKVDKAGAVYTMLANAPGRALPWVLLRLILGTLLRTLAYLVGKVPGQALDEVSGLAGTLLRPLRILGARRHRGRAIVDHRDLRPLFPPPGATVRATVEQVASNLSGRAEPDRSSGGRHGAVESGPGDDDADFFEVEQFAQVKRFAQKPGPVLFAVLLLVSLIACRSLLAGGSLAGGALLPAPESVSDLGARYTDAWHPVGIGGVQTAPPYLAALALVATLLFGSTGLALTLLLVCSVPLAGLTAYFASRPLVDSRLVRAWAAVAYAFLPAATGALAGGRIGTAVLAVVLPLLARAALASSGLRGRPTWRSVWAYALLLTLTTAFTPVTWAMAVFLAVVTVVLAQRRGDGLAGAALRAAVVAGTPVLLLAPWSLSLLNSPSRLFTEAGLPYGKGAADALDLLTLSPGGPGTSGGLLSAGIVLAALAALLRADRQTPVRVAWAVALTGLVFAVLADAQGWAGPATLVYGIALLSAAAVGAEGARERVASQNFGWKQPVAGLIAAAAVAAPLLSAVGWMIGGADGPLTRRSPVQVPAFVAEESTTQDQARTLVLDGEEGTSPNTTGRISHAVVRGSGARLGDADLAAAAGSDTRLDEVVAHLAAGSGAEQTDRLGSYAVAYVLVREGAPRQLSRTLDATPGLTRLSQEDGSALWRIDTEVSRLSVVPGGAQKPDDGSPAPAPVVVPAGPVEAHTDLPAGGDGRVLRFADRADPGWHATLDGRELTPVTIDDWAQGFELPAEGGRLDVTYETPLTHTVWLWTQAILVLVVLVLALPGRRRDVDDDLPEADTVPAQPVAGEGRARHHQHQLRAVPQRGLQHRRAVVGGVDRRTRRRPVRQPPGLRNAAAERSAAAGTHRHGSDHHIGVVGTGRELFHHPVHRAYFADDQCAAHRVRLTALGLEVPVGEPTAQAGEHRGGSERQQGDAGRGALADEHPEHGQQAEQVEPVVQGGQRAAGLSERLLPVAPIHGPYAHPHGGRGERGREGTGPTCGTEHEEDRQRGPHDIRRQGGGHVPGCLLPPVVARSSAPGTRRRRTRHGPSATGQTHGVSLHEPPTWNRSQQGGPPTPQGAARRHGTSAETLSHISAVSPSFAQFSLSCPKSLASARHVIVFPGVLPGSVQEWAGA